VQRIVIMRLFVAVDIDDDTRAAIGRLIDRLRAAMEGARSAARISWIESERLHLTLQFIGEVSDAAGEAIVTRLRPPVALPPFEMRLGDIGTFPPAGRPRVVWLGIERGGEGLVRLHAEVARRLADVAFRRESRPFSPHLTLGRVKDGGSRFDGDRLRKTEAERAGGCTIDHVTLYQSRLSPRGPTYTPLLLTPLTGAERVG
jgi:2'-5' RNA ligase